MISEEMEQLVKLFDFALTSDNPAVKKALKNLLLLVSIVEPEEDNKTPGPLRQLQDEIMKLRKEIMRLSTDLSLIKEREKIGNTSYPTYPTSPTIYPNTTQYPPYHGTWIVNTSSNTLSDINTSSLSTANIGDLASVGLNTDTLESLIQEYNLNSKDTKTI